VRVSGILQRLALRGLEFLDSISHLDSELLSNLFSQLGYLLRHSSLKGGSRIVQTRQEEC
jgi:hypothetical protein